jgi:hypothetical protein
VNAARAPQVREQNARQTDAMIDGDANEASLTVRPAVEENRDTDLDKKCGRQNRHNILTLADHWAQTPIRSLRRESSPSATFIAKGSDRSRGRGFNQRIRDAAGR